MGTLEWIPRVIERFPLKGLGKAIQVDASTQSVSEDKIISTDPPYYDNICYADPSDFFLYLVKKFS